MKNDDYVIETWRVKAMLNYLKAHNISDAAKSIIETYLKFVDETSFNKKDDNWQKGYLQGVENTAKSFMDEIIHNGEFKNRDIGRWTLLDEGLYDNVYACSKCGRRIYVKPQLLSKYPYCHCGCKMEDVVT